ncbi:TrbC/VirB2 family protein [Candidatus Uhrbacteria bacterium]|nr:TrbC/VirB2 family protein [Candidatus Uhrbacteria bacterium]
MSYKLQAISHKLTIFIAIFIGVILFLPQKTLAQDCGSITDCQAFQYCGSGRCVNQKADGSSCFNRQECLGGACDNGSCAEDCGDDSHCGNPSQYCSNDVCVNKVSDGGACPQGNLQCQSGSCVEGTCARRCVLNSDCPDGFRCSGGACETGAPPKRVGEACRPEDTCASGRCDGGICRCTAERDCLIGQYCAPQGNCENKKSGGENCNENTECFSGVCSGRPKKCAEEEAGRRGANCCLCRDGIAQPLLPDEDGNQACPTKCGDGNFVSVSSDPDICGGAALPPEQAGGSEEAGGGRSFLPRLIPEACTRGATETSKCGLPQLIQVGINIVRLILAISGSLALFMFIYGGFKWLTAAGVAEQVDEGRKILTGAVIGLIIIFGAATIINFAQQTLITREIAGSRCQDLSTETTSFECTEINEAEFQSKIDSGECLQGYCPGGRLNICCKTTSEGG